ncbi:hypothetical protein D3C81_1164250 [compost metagenome]
MPSAAVVVRAPAQTPSSSAGWKWNTYLAMNMPMNSGTAVAKMPHRNRLMPSFWRPATKPGPAEMPTTAMNTFRPTEFMNQTVGSGMRPKVGWMARYQPKMMPAISAPPAVDSVSGMPDTFSTMAPIRAPAVIASDMKATSVTVVGRST